MKSQLGSVFCPLDSSSRRSSRGCCWHRRERLVPLKSFSVRDERAAGEDDIAARLTGKRGENGACPRVERFLLLLLVVKLDLCFWAKDLKATGQFVFLLVCFFGVFLSSAAAMGKEVSAVVDNSFFFPLLLVADQCRSGLVMLFWST